jgi:hypothetical protein
MGSITLATSRITSMSARSTPIIVTKSLPTKELIIILHSVYEPRLEGAKCVLT